MRVSIPGQDRVIAHYGEEAQSMIHMEECGELIQAVSKMRRAKAAYIAGAQVDDNAAYYNLLEEMADVLICMEQMKEIYGISDFELQKIVDRKVKRQETRLDESERRLFEKQPVYRLWCGY